jgi:hypothetical protein
MRYRAPVTPGSTSWAQAVLPVLVSAALLFIPGTVFARLLGAPLLLAASVAPAVSTTVLSLAGLAAGRLELPWTPWSALVATGLAWLLAVVLRRALRRWTDQDAAPRRAAPSGTAAVGLATLGGLAVTTVVVSAVLVFVSRTPDHFPQHPDTIFHLAAARWMVEHQDISALHAMAVINDGLAGAYPAAFHGIVATTAMVTDTNVVVASSAVVLVTAALVWPLGMMLLARALFGDRPEVALSAAVASVLFTGYPFALMGFGVLWPNLFGQTLLPSLIALTMAAAVRLAPHAAPMMAAVPAGVIAVLGLPGLLLAHPNAFITYFVIAYLVLATATLGRAWSERARPGRSALLVAAVVVTTAVAGLAWYVVRRPGMLATGERGPELSEREALLDTLQFSPRDVEPLVLAAVLVAVGAAWILVRGRGARWVVAALLLFQGLFFLNVGVDNDLARLLTWPWYNNAFRLAAVAVLPAALAAAAGLVGIGALLAAPLRRWRAAGLVTSTAAVVALLLATQAYVDQHRGFLDGYFFPGRARSWASDAELRALRTLATHIPQDALTAANPWNGGTYLYVVSGRRVLVPTEKALRPGDRELLAASLDQAGSDPEVCAAARRQNVEFALTGGVPFLWAEDRVELYRGIDAVGSSDAFTKVATAGPYTLYRLTGCAAG